MNSELAIGQGRSLKDQKGIDESAKANASLHLFAIFAAFLTLVLLVAGALVTSNEAGDSVSLTAFSSKAMSGLKH